MKVIVCFDIESEIIREIMLPQHIARPSLVRRSSDLFLFHIGPSYILNIWLLENEGEIKDVWTEKFTVDLHKLGDLWSWSGDFRNNDEIILLKHCRSGCVYMSYDIKKDEPTAIIHDLSFCS